MITDEDFEKLIGKYKSIEEFRLMLNNKQKQMTTTNKTKTKRQILPTDREQATQLWNSYMRANKTRRQVIVARYGYSVVSNFESNLKKRIQG